VSAIRLVPLESRTSGFRLSFHTITARIAAAYNVHSSPYSKEKSSYHEARRL
jgi:hypothetical protein